MNVGDKAPEILGINEKGEEIRLSNYKGKNTSTRRTVHQVAQLRPATCATTTTPCAKPATKW